MDVKTLVIVSFVATLSGCVSPADKSSEPEEFPRFQHTSGNTNDGLLTPPEPMKLGLTKRLPLPEPVALISDSENERLYSFAISNMDIKEALRMFARAYELNIVVDDDVQGVLDVEFHDLPLTQAVPLMLGSGGYYWTTEDGIIRIRSQETRQFTVDYLRLIRTGAGNSSAKVSSASGAADSGDAAGGDESGSVTIGHTDEVHFWEELEAQINALISDKGEVVVNRLSGTIAVTDQHAHVQKIGDYLDTIQRAIHRQVEIQVSIIEISLSNNQALGVNWSRIASALDTTDAVNLDINGQVGTPAGGFNALGEVFSLGYTDSNSNREVTALVSALEEQGDVQVVSQPHIRTINNQTSLIKVGTDRTFFRREQSTDSTSAGSITTSSDVAQVVTEGVVLSITPQISSSGHVLMDISPVVTRVSSVSTVEDDSGAIRSSAPNLDVAQVTSLVRARSGETVVIGGLIQTQESDTQRQVPGTGWLGPLKNLAGGTYKVDIKKELIMVMTPVIVAAE
ncbi:MAG: secretin N-terminal domain-containing protein [Gammaproteobacteria bacterium]|nr:secretin N-terminal domain-containing protein [Gammaproteobacteria bacterium]